MNTVPSFITSNGPVREVRFVRNPDGSPDGGVHGLFTIRGRMDASGCDLKQPNFAQQFAAGNVIFRIPTPTYGLGLVEATPDSTLQANLAANRQIKSQLGISGSLNTSGNDGTVTRFGWKAQNKSLMVFAGEAYNVEQGVSNEAFVNERGAVAGCVYNGSPEDATKMLNDTGGRHRHVAADVFGPDKLRRLHAPLRCRLMPAPMSNSAGNGAKLFSSVGCALCHTSTLTTGMSKFTGMSSVTYHPYSDFAVHHMGPRPVGWRQPGSGRSGPVPHGSALGSWTTPVLPARWPDVRPVAGDSGPCFGLRKQPLPFWRKHQPKLWIGSQRRDPPIQLAQPLADAGCVELPAFVVT